MSEESLPPGTTDEALMPRIAAGDAAAFAELFRRRQPEVYRFALHMSASKTIAEDVTQDVFLHVMRDAARFEPARGAVGSWLLGIARNFVRRRFERERVLQPLADDSGQEVDLPAAAEDPLGDLTRAEQIELLKRAILTLPLRYREAIVLCDIQELTYADAAAALECAVGTVRSRLHRGRTLLAAKLTALEQLPASAGGAAGRPFRSRSRCIA
jgi:RNA polymerase sigma-70 factor (ECF subfamily)